MVTSLNQGKPARDSGYLMLQYVCGRLTAAGAAATVSTKIGSIPAGSIITHINTKVGTAFTGTTPTLNVGTTAAGTDLVAGVALTAGSVNSMPAAGIVMPLAADLDIWANVTGTATGDAFVIVFFVRPAL